MERLFLGFDSRYSGLNWTGTLRILNGFMVASVSFIWSSVKNISPQVKANVTWQVGNGHLIRFWEN